VTGGFASRRGRTKTPGAVRSSGDANGTVGGMASYLAIDVGTVRLVAGVVDDAGEAIVRDRVTTPPRDVWPALHRLVRRVVAARPVDADPLELCGVSCEGPIDREKGTVEPMHLPALHHFELR
jgi:predicted NBD/HSP70 family sugar kinase